MSKSKSKKTSLNKSQKATSRISNDVSDPDESTKTESKTLVEKKQLPVNKPLASEKKPLAPEKKTLASEKKTLAPKKESLAGKETDVTSNENHKVPQDNLSHGSSKKMSKTSQNMSETENISVKTVHKKSGSGLSLFAILLSLIAIAGAAFTWYQVQVIGVQANTSLALGVNDIGSQVTRVSDSVAFLQKVQNNTVSQEQLTNRLLKADVVLDKQLTVIKREQQSLSESVLSIKDDLQKGTNEYVVDEVSQLLKLGNNSAIFSGDASAAIKAFRLADIQLKELANPRFSVVRVRINEEIELLKAVDVVDIESALARLSTVSNSISTLALENEPPVLESANNKSEELNEQEITWASEVKKMLSEIINSVSIQRVGEAPKPLLAPAERYFLDQNFKLAMTKAEIALLQNRQALYLSSLGDAEQWLNDYFDLDASNVKEALATITTLKETKFSQKLPSVIGSYDLLQSIKGGQ